MKDDKKGRIMMGSDCIKEEKKECVVIEKDLKNLYLKFIEINENMMVYV
jgi:hypothetical protein